MEIFRRSEYKYLVPLELLGRLRSLMAPFLVADSYAAATGLDQYTVRSIYFDTPGLADYWEKIEGISRRKKIRVRAYNSRNPQTRYFLEIKQKEQRCVSKQRSSIDPAQSAHIFELLDDLSVLPPNGKLLPEMQAFYYQIYRNALKPVILIVYEREAYFHKFNRELRITFDFNLRSAFKNSVGAVFDDQQMRWSLQENFIMEIKFSTGYPGWLSKIISRCGLEQAAISKYSICLAEQLNHQPLYSRMRSRGVRQPMRAFLQN